MIPLIFDWPVGLPEERAQWHQLPGAWVAATRYAEKYRLGYHTGLDLNLNRPYFDADAHAPVYAAADGEITFAGKLPVWGSVIVMSHIAGDVMLWTRYAHVEAMAVQRNDHIPRGRQLARVGNADGRYPYHLHYDIARIDLTSNPGDWPGHNLKRVYLGYFDPEKLMREQLMEGEGARPTRVKVNTTSGLRVRQEPESTALRIGLLLNDSIVEIVEQQGEWGRIEKPQQGWIMMRYTEPVK